MKTLKTKMDSRLKMSGMTTVEMKTGVIRKHNSAFTLTPTLSLKGEGGFEIFELEVKKLWKEFYWSV